MQNAKSNLGSKFNTNCCYFGLVFWKYKCVFKKIYSPATCLMTFYETRGKEIRKAKSLTKVGDKIKFIKNNRFELANISEAITHRRKIHIDIFERNCIILKVNNANFFLISRKSVKFQFQAFQKIENFQKHQV